MAYGIYSGSGPTKFKDDLQSLVTQKLRSFAVFPVNITPALKDRIRNLQEEFLEVRQSKKFTKEKGIAMLTEIDSINEDLKKLPKKTNAEEEEEEEFEFRKRKSTKTKTKRKPVKRKK
jgi:hypothetical protein